MDQVDEQSDFIVEFTVRNDKDRGLLIEKFDYKDDTYFFKHQDMPVSRHCEQVQRIIRSVGVQRTKKIRIDTTEFSFEYFADEVPSFKFCRLNSVNAQMRKAADSYINKEIGIKKRNVTVAQNKQRKIEQKNSAISFRMNAAQRYFVEERNRRFVEVFGVPPSQDPPTSDVPPTPDVPPQIRRVVLPTVTGTGEFSAMLPVAIARPSSELALNSQPPTLPMDDLPAVPDDDDL